MLKKFTKGVGPKTFDDKYYLNIAYNVFLVSSRLFTFSVTCIKLGECNFYKKKLNSVTPKKPT